MIKHTIKFIIKNATKFKMCSSCNDVNSSKNEHCINCGDNAFREMDDEDIYDLRDCFTTNESLDTSFKNT